MTTKPRHTGTGWHPVYSIRKHQFWQVFFPSRNNYHAPKNLSSQNVFLHIGKHHVGFTARTLHWLNVWDHTPTAVYHMLHNRKVPAVQHRALNRKGKPPIQCIISNHIPFTSRELRHVLIWLSVVFFCAFSYPLFAL